MSRLQELYEEKDRINAEINQIEKADREEYERERIAKHEKLVGKCFKAKDCEKDGVRLFKILKVIHLNSADCLKLAKENHQIIVARDYDFGVWYAYGGYRSKGEVIDHYIEISQAEFNEEWDRYLTEIKES